MHPMKALCLRYLGNQRKVISQWFPMVAVSSLDDDVNKVLIGRGWSGGISGERSVMSAESEVEKQSVLNCRYYQEHWGIRWERKRGSCGRTG